jgi:hypothetical protein
MGKDTDKSGKRSVAKEHLPSRRKLLKGAAAVAGAAAGSSVIGAPVIWAQEIKDIELRHVGVSYSVVKAIGDQAAKDLGFKVTMQNLDTSAAINRFITQPNSVDIPRGLAGEARRQAGCDPGYQHQEGQGVRQFPADLHQGRIRPICTTVSPTGRRSSRKSTTPTRLATGPIWSIIPSPNGRICSIPNTRARPPSSTCRRSA